MNEDIIAISAWRDPQAVKVHVRGGASPGADWPEGISSVKISSEVIAVRNAQGIADASS